MTNPVDQTTFIKRFGDNLSDTSLSLSRLEGLISQLDVKLFGHYPKCDSVGEAEPLIDISTLSGLNVAASAQSVYTKDLVDRLENLLKEL